MGILLVVVIASLAGACVVEEPVGELAGDAWSEAEAESESQAEPDVEPIRWSPICVDHYVCCQDSKLSDEWDGWNQTRCDTCSRLCHQ
jgi:hypothetical protein